MLEIRFLGEFDVRLNGQPVEIPSRPAQSLLAYLVLNAETRHRREKLAGLLWPESEESNARSNLRHALWRLRKTIGEEYFLADKVSIAFNTSDECDFDVSYLMDETADVTSYDSLIHPVSVYGGELLPGFYESWVVLERERLRAAFEHAIQKLLNLLVAKESWLEVLEWGERWIALGYVPEPAFRALMIAHSGLGDSSGAASVYQRCCEALRNELGVEPSEQTRTTYDWISKGGKPSTAEQVIVEPARGGASTAAISMLIKQWRLKGVEILDLASLAMVHAARTDDPYESEDAALLIRSALHHEVDVDPWLKRAGSPQIAVAALSEVLSTYPKPRVRMRIIEALKDVEGEDAEDVLLHIVESDDSGVVRAEAAVAAANRGKLEAVVERLLVDLNPIADASALAAFVAVANEVGLPKDIGPYPKVSVAIALAQRRWQAHRAGIFRQIGRAAIGGALAMAIISVTSIVQDSFVNPEGFHEKLEFVALSAWVFTNALLGLVWGGLQAVTTAFLVGLSDALWTNNQGKWIRFSLASLSGLVQSVFIIFTASVSGTWASVGEEIYVPIYIAHGLFVGAALSLIVPPLGSIAPIRRQMVRYIWTSLIIAVIGALSVYLAYSRDIGSARFHSDLVMFLFLALLFPLGIALALGQRKGDARANKQFV